MVGKIKCTSQMLVYRAGRINKKSPLTSPISIIQWHFGILKNNCLFSQGKLRKMLLFFCKDSSNQGGVKLYTASIESCKYTRKQSVVPWTNSVRVYSEPTWDMLYMRTLFPFWPTFQSFMEDVGCRCKHNNIHTCYVCCTWWFLWLQTPISQVVIRPLDP